MRERPRAVMLAYLWNITINASMEKKLIQLTKEQMAWLRKEAKRTGTPINVLIRQMVSEKIKIGY